MVLTCCGALICKERCEDFDSKISEFQAKKGTCPFCTKALYMPSSILPVGEARTRAERIRTNLKEAMPEGLRPSLHGPLSEFVMRKLASLGAGSGNEAPGMGEELTAGVADLLRKCQAFAQDG